MGIHTPLQHYRIGLIERRHPQGHRGSIVEQLVPALSALGARVDLVHAEEILHRADVQPPWDVAVLKSGSAAALHIAAIAEGWGIPCINTSASTRLAQDKLASTALLQRSGIPIAAGYLAWLPLTTECSTASLHSIGAQKVLIKAARGSQGAGLWTAEAGQLTELVPDLPAGPYLLMKYIPHRGNDLKVFVAGSWMSAIDRPFPAKTLEEKRGKPEVIPPEVAHVAQVVGERLGLTCYGCDFVRSTDGWMLVDVNAFPGFKGPQDAPAALAAEISRIALGGRP